MEIDNDKIEYAASVMMDFAERTGLSSDAPPVRYLWTDAFAVCNFLGLARATGDEKYRDLTYNLIDQVHTMLGRHRKDDPRSGWLSGLSEEEGHKHPTRGGVRIGKAMPERKPDEPFDERMEWNRDGQYFHYLTKWMHALDLAARESGEARYAQWASELALTATRAFVYEAPGGRPQMSWKMSIDISRPLVPLMGHHDPLDGYITAQQLRATAKEMSLLQERLHAPGEEVDLDEIVGVYADMVKDRDWTTIDALGLGGLMMDATHLVQLIQQGSSNDLSLLIELLRSAETGLRHWEQTGALSLSALQRLAFRELGLAIGLEGVRLMNEWATSDTFKETNVQQHLDAFSAYFPAGDHIITFWLEPDNRENPMWMEHEDINAVMLATASPSVISAAFAVATKPSCRLPVPLADISFKPSTLVVSLLPAPVWKVSEVLS